EITAQGVDTITQGNCPNSFSVTRTWTFTDACGNSSSVAQTITVDDNVAPTFNETAPADTTASCDNIPTAAELTATDNCGNATVTMSETIIQGNCPSNYQIVRTWTAADACGNSIPVSQTISVTDTTGPVAIDTPLLVKVDATCDNIPGVPTLVFTDNCSGTVVTPEPTITTSTVVDGVYTITRTWVATDACGNLSQTYTQFVYVTQVDEVIQSNTEACNAAEFDTINLNTFLPEGTSGGQWSDPNNVGGLNGSIFNAWQLPLGVQTYTYTINTGGCPRRYEVLIDINDECIPFACERIVIHNAFTPNGDAFNQYFNIEYIENVDCYPTNNVQIFNRWGVLVYETKNYDNNTRRFEGISEGRATVSKSEELPTGTYFYIIEWTTTTGERIVKDGYLYLTR
ncbi:MAG: gliding motility-associated C-terminal domain-containing protein, partial [Flavobacterium sp.]|nr:gliding motility-associated C-terminal domain-containing protein [Flavobacterium sp.]